MRGRRAFRYHPEDSDDSSALQSEEFLDEEEQDSLIQSLDDENARTNRLYSRILLIMALISISPYLRTLFNPALTLFSMLSITSLLSTAYLLAFLPPGQTNIAFIDNVPQLSTQKLDPSQCISLPPSQGPIMQFLPYLNLGLCVILVLLGTMKERQAEEIWFGLCFIPIVNYGAALITACFMGSVNPQQELNTLKYTYKGA